ncbi:MAG: sugar transferase [Bacteroidota bacterium]
MKCIFDIFSSFVGIIILLPVFIIISLLVFIGSGFPIFYLQKRVGKNGKDFLLYKFRTMKIGSDKNGLLTIGKKNSSITSVGYFLRKYKLDELPQLFNVLVGDMSLVGPRPEVRKYVEMYSEEQKNVLSVKPGITDYASIKYSNESEILSKSENPEQFYISEIMSAKLKLNLRYIKEQSMLTDLKIIFKTFGKIF